jgi:DNA-binding transcriptional MerR regulator
MKEYYTIGETAKLLGVSTQTLRYYDRIELLNPVHIDENNGYRYYSYRQFHTIDRIRYMQDMGMSLDDITEVIRSGQNEKMFESLLVRKEELNGQIAELKRQMKTVDWTINYLTYINNAGDDPLIEKSRFYTLHQPERYIVRIRCRDGESLEDMEIRLADLKGSKECSDLHFYRQYGYILDVDALFDGAFIPEYYFIYLDKKHKLDKEFYTVLPEADYICFQTQLLHENWDFNILQKSFAHPERPSFALALEYEDNLVDWSDAWYEVQMLLTP